MPTCVSAGKGGGGESGLGGYWPERGSSCPCRFWTFHNAEADRSMRLNSAPFATSSNSTLAIVASSPQFVSCAHSPHTVRQTPGRRVWSENSARGCFSTLLSLACTLDTAIRIFFHLGLGILHSGTSSSSLIFSTHPATSRRSKRCGPDTFDGFHDLNPKFRRRLHLARLIAAAHLAHFVQNIGARYTVRT